MEEEILSGVGKKTRIGFQKGAISEKELLKIYTHNKREADKIHLFGMKYNDLRNLYRESHNPILKSRIEKLFTEKDEKDRKSCDQNKTSLQKLKELEENALGIGLKRVLHIIRKINISPSDKNFLILSTLIEAEYANLCAKRNKKKTRQCYDRKSYLLEKAAYFAKNSDWKYGYNNSTGKNASYIIYFYLPDGEQLSWHTKDFTIYQRFPYLDVEWDGKICSTMSKLLSYLESTYSHLLQNSVAA